MPTYDYRCDGCGHREEIFQSMSDNPKNTCPKCKKRKFKRLIGTGAGIIFKGSGFYETDYRSSSYQSDAKKDSDADSGSGSDAGKTGGDSAPTSSSDD